jgi:actin-related protein 9
MEQLEGTHYLRWSGPPQPDTTTNPSFRVARKMAPFKTESIIIIAPGSRVTSAQMGVPETPTPPRYQFPSRMFPSSVPGQYDPVKSFVRKRVKASPPSASQEQTNGVQNGTIPNGEQKEKADVEMTKPGGQANGTAESVEEMEEYIEEDPLSDEGAVWPIVQGRIVNKQCFAALLTHVFQSCNPNFNSPVMIVAQPAWSIADYEFITRLVFQQWTSPALHIADAASVALWGIGAETGLIVDVGYEKCDITPIYQFIIDHTARRAAIPGCGGRDMTLKLQELLQKQDFTEDMAEQLKKSNICEILPVGVELPTSQKTVEPVANPAAAASTGATASGADAKDVDGGRPGQAPRGPGVGTEVGQGEEEDNEGVLDIASIVAKDNAAELLAKREQEKAAKAAAKKGGAQEPPRQIRLKNSEKDKAMFSYRQIVPIDTVANGNGESRLRKQDTEVGIERFLAMEPLRGESMGVLQKIAVNIHGAILSSTNLQARPTLWDNIIVCGNGSRIKGESSELSLSCPHY